jgi:hypothetical protein
LEISKCASWVILILALLLASCQGERIKQGMNVRQAQPQSCARHSHKALDCPPNRRAMAVAMIYQGTFTAGIGDRKIRSAFGYDPTLSGFPDLRCRGCRSRPANGSPLSYLFSGGEMGAPGVQVV